MKYQASPFHRMLTLLLCFAMFISMVPVSAMAEEPEPQAVSGIVISQSITVPEYTTANGTVSQVMEYDCGNGVSGKGEKSYLTIVTGTPSSEFTAYRNVLANAGYQLVSTNEVASDTASDPNRFATYKSPDGSYKVYTYHLPVYQETRIIVDTQKDTVAGFSYTPTGESVEPMIVQYGLSMSENGYDNTTTTAYSTNKRNCGALTIIRMPDNSLFIHDGGDLEQWSDDACDRFLQFCRELTGKTNGEKMVINTWFLSHAHTDHYLGFPRFFSKHYDKFDLKYIMYNIDIERTYTTRDIHQIMSRISSYYPNVKYYKPHTGETFNIAGIGFDVIYSHEDRYLPNENGELITDYPTIVDGTPTTAYDVGGTYREFCYEADGKSDFNDTSVVLRVHMDSETDALLYADMNLAEQILFDIYPDSYLETDIMMIPHHGFDSHPELCDLSNAKIFLFTQHRGAIYGADGDLDTKDGAGKYRPALYDNYLEMQKYIETAGSKTYWAGNETVCITVNSNAGAASPLPSGMTQDTEAPAGFTAYTADAVSFEYEGWSVDYNDGTTVDGEWVDDFSKVVTNTHTMRFDPVTNKKLDMNKQYVIVHERYNDSDERTASYVLMVDAANKITSGEHIGTAAQATAGTTNFYYYTTTTGENIYGPLHYRDQAMWKMLNLQGTGVMAKMSTAGYFGGTVTWQYSMYAKGLNTDANYWYTTAADTDAIRQLQPNNANCAMATPSTQRVFTEFFDDNTCLIYYYKSDGTVIYVLTCDENGNWGRKTYNDTKENNIKNVKADLDDLKMRLYYYREFNAFTELSYEGVQEYTLLDTVTKEQTIALITSNIEIKETQRRNRVVPCSGTTPKTSHYYLVFPEGYDASKPGDYVVTLQFRNDDGTDTLVGSVVVHVDDQIPVSGSRLDMAGTVSKNAGVGAVPVIIDPKTGNSSPCRIEITYNTDDGQVTMQLPLSVGMLTDANGNAIDTSIEGTYSGLTVTYQGVVLTGTFTLTVTASNDALNYPLYPEEGSVRVTKQGITTLGDFSKTGVANIQLSATGKPTSNGVDLIVVMDLSGSMKYSLDTITDAQAYADSRVYAMEESLRQMVTLLRESGADVRIAMSDFGDLDSHEFEGAIIDKTAADKPFFDADFNNAYKRGKKNADGVYADVEDYFYEFSNYKNFAMKNGDDEAVSYPIANSKFNIANPSYTGKVVPTIYTGSKEANAEAFVHVNTLDEAAMNEIVAMLDVDINKSNGTNYDVGLEYAYHLGMAIQQKNIDEGQDRDLVVLFMSDGAPMQFNYFAGRTVTPTWTAWITGNADGIQSLNYSETNKPAGMAELEEILLARLKAGKLVMPSYRRDGSVEGTDGVGYFKYDSTKKPVAEYFYSYMDAHNYDLDWQYLVDIANANGYTNFTYDQYLSNPKMQDLIDKLKAGTLVNPYYNTTQYYPQYTGTSTDFFTAMAELDYEVNWDLFAKIAYRNRNGSHPANSSVKVGQRLMTMLQNIRTLPDDGYYTLSPYAYFYNPDGLNWWAEAIKGKTTQLYPVINKYAYHNSTERPFAYYGDVRNNFSGETTQGLALDKQDYIGGFRGLDADIYSVSFSIANEAEISAADAESVMRHIATGPSYFFSANTKEGLTDALKAIAATVSSGASRAWYTDTMGPEFDLSTSKTVTVDGKEITVNADPTIRVLEYQLDETGARKGEPIVREVVRFEHVPTNGTTQLKAWSDQVYDIDSSSGTITNVYTERWGDDGIIRAKYFYYNTNKYVDENNTGAVRIDLTGDGVPDYPLPAETFLWVIGVIGETEMVLDYEVYLTGSMEETREAGLYDTNTKAELQYINYLGNNCAQEVPTPKYPWKQGSVGYSFYLVDRDGNPIINQETGVTGSFELSVELIDIIYETFNLDGKEHTLSAEELLQYVVEEGIMPDGYKLYDDKASYTVTVDNTAAPGEVNGTYSVEIGTERPTTWISGLGYDDVLPKESGKDYTVTDASTANTVVWFAVYVDVQTYPDAVVIDYGIPVNIHVMANDKQMPSKYAKLSAIGAHQTAGYVTTLGSGFGNTYTGTYGTATIINTDASDAVIRYTLNTSNGMQMSAPEQFSYAVDYAGPYSETGYYYETITVIPAANIYYEDSYLTFTDSSAAGNGMGNWQNEYTSISVSCYNTGNWDEVYAYCKSDSGPAGVWPGVKMVDNDNDNIYTAYVSADQVGKTVMFNNGDKAYQTSDLPVTNNGIYKVDNSWHSNSSATVYFNNADGWENVYIYWWAGSTNNGWPGTQMSYSAATGLYSISVPAGMTNIIFNNTAGTQTGDLGIVDMGVYQPDGTITPSTSETDKTVYFDTENCPWDQVYAYCWNGSIEHAKWPGTAMTLDSTTGLYSITIPYDMTNIIFTNNKSGEGHNLGEHTIQKDGEVYREIHWEYSTADLDVIFDNTTSGWDDVYAYFWSYGNTSMTSWPGVKMVRGENNLFTTTIPVNAEYIIFSNGTSLKQTVDIPLAPSGTTYYPDGTTSNVNSAPRTYYYSGDNWDEVYAYAFGTYGEQNAGWPGEQMTYDANTGLYSITLYDANLRTIIFNNGGKGEQTNNLSLPAAGSIYHGDIWVGYEGDPIIQEEDRPGAATDALKDIDADNIYGYDSAYDKYQTYSLDGVHYVTVDKATGKPTTAPTATFTFTGTGFDVVGLTDSDSGAITVEVKDANGKVVTNYIVNNYYGMVYDSTTGTWKVAEENDDFCLYQVPVMKVENLTYGVYTVTIKAAYLKSMDMEDAKSYTIWLDAIRIYNPAKNNGTANDAYTQDGENNAYLTTVKELLVTPSDYTAGTNVNGVIYIEGKGSNVTIAEYAHQGPNNETYLKNGNGIAFKLRYKGTAAPSINLHLGAKLAVGSSATLNCNGKALTTLTTATNMFYKLDGLTWTKDGNYMVSNAIVLSCTAGTDSILSITDLKVTGKDASKIESMPSANLTMLTDEDVVETADKYMAVYAEDPTVTLSANSFSLSFEDEILVNFYYTVSNVSNVTEQGMLVFHTNPGSADIAIADQKYSNPIYTESTGLYACTTTGIAAKEMGDSRYYCAYAKLSDGTYAYSDLHEYSPKQYAMSRLEKSTDENMKALCVAMLNYGAAAQEYFGYNTDALMNADLTAEQQALVAAYNADLFTGAVAADPAKVGSFAATETGFNRTSVSVSFDGAFALNFYFTPNSADQEVTFTYWTKEAYENADVLNSSNATGSMNLTADENGLFHAPIAGIAAKELDDTIYVAATYTVDGETFCTGVIAYSLSTYCMKQANGNMGQLAQATAMYGYYAANYFA